MEIPRSTARLENVYINTRMCMYTYLVHSIHLKYNYMLL